jgi:hypothetical protein
MRKEFTLAELDTQSVELLPPRETLFYGSNNWAAVYASNSALAVNAGTIFSSANATAAQAVIVSQG